MRVADIPVNSDEKRNKVPQFSTTKVKHIKMYIDPQRQM